ncbi:MAG: PAS domain S-box protein [Smithella sp.]
MKKPSETGEKSVQEISALKQQIREMQESIADHIKAEEELRKKCRFLSDLVENSGNIICIKDIKRRYELVNRKWEEVTGLKRESVIGRTGEELFTELISKQFQENDLEVINSGKVLETEEILEDEQGKRFFISTKFPMRNDDGIIKCVGMIVTEITARKEAEIQREAAIEALNKSRSLVCAITDSAQDAILMMDAAGCISFWNPAAENIFGFTGKEAMGRNLHQLLAPGRFQETFYAAFEGFKATGQGAATGKIIELQACRKNGEEFPVELSLSALHLEDGWHALGIMRDITARKQVEQELQKSEALYRTFINATSDMVFLKDEQLRNIVVNRPLAAFFGKSEGEIIGKSDFDLMPQIAAERCRHTDMDALTSKSVVTSEEVIGDDVYETLKFPVKLGKDKTGVGGYIRNITERKRVEEELLESRRRLEDTIEFLPDATFVIDKDGKVIAWNRAMEAMTDVKKENILGKGDYEYALPFYGERRPVLIDYVLHPDKKMTAPYPNIRKLGNAITAEDVISNTPRGDVYLYAAASVLRDSRGNVIAAIECLRDDTERNKLAARLNRAEKMEALGTLAGGVAHDLNNVLGVLAGYSEMLVGMMPADSTPRRYAENILQSSVKSAAIIQDLLTMARRGVAVSEVVNLNKIISDYFRTPEFENLKSLHPRIKIITELGNGLLNIKGSPVHLSKTIMNLISNAEEAIADRGQIAIRTENRYLDYIIKGYDEMKEGDYVVLTVSDTGSGIPAKDLSKIFEPFYTKKVMGRSGTGLGLAVVWGTVKDHNGYIDVQSREGIGTTFTLYFPVTREEIRKIEKAVSPVAYMGKGQSILVVDDVHEQRELAKSMLEMLDYQVETVASGEEAVEYLKSKRANLIILDMIMDPGIDGMETYRRILETNPGQKAIIVSGFSETERVRKTQEMGAGDFIRKPYVLEKIGLAIKNELDEK